MHRKQESRAAGHFQSKATVCSLTAFWSERGFFQLQMDFFFFFFPLITNSFFAQVVVAVQKASALGVLGWRGSLWGLPAKTVWCWLKRVFLLCTAVFKMQGKPVWSIIMIMTQEWNYERNYNYHFYAQLINHKILHYRFFFFFYLMKFIIEAPEALNLMLNKLNLCLGLGLLAQMWPWIANTGLSDVGAAVPDQTCCMFRGVGFWLPWYLLWVPQVSTLVFTLGSSCPSHWKSWVH